jgi:uncharacterized membrane protein YfcA
VVIFLNAVSGSAGYIRRHRVDIRTGLVLAAGTVPGALIGPMVAMRIPHRIFHVLFGAFLIGVAIVLLLRRKSDTTGASSFGGNFLSMNRAFTDAEGTRYEISYTLPVALGISFCVGFLGSIFGIGGGLIHVPAMMHLMGFPIHVATATSTFVLTITSITAISEYARRGLVDWPLAGSLGIGVMIGAQLATAVSHRVKAVWLVRLLTLAMVVLGARMLL